MLFRADGSTPIIGKCFTTNTTINMQQKLELFENFIHISTLQQFPDGLTFPPPEQLREPELQDLRARPRLLLGQPQPLWDTH